jgi:hypothetical protein
VTVNVNVDTTTSIFYLDGDTENDATEDADNRVRFNAGRTVKAAELLTLEATTGLTTIDLAAGGFFTTYITAAGSLSLVAGSGMYLWNDVLGQPGEAPFVINADYDSGGDGTLTVAADSSITTNDGAITITAWDIVLSDVSQPHHQVGGAVTAGIKPLSVHGSQTGQTIGLGVTSKDMHLTNAEISRMTSLGGVRVGGTLGGSITVHGVTTASSDQLSPVVSLVALSDGSSVTFSGLPSTFNAVAAQADDGASALVNVDATLGIVYLDGDLDDSSTADNNTKVQFGAGVTVSANTLLTVEATTGLLIGAGS